MSDEAPPTPEPPGKSTVTVTIDGVAHEAPPGQLVIEACGDAGIESHGANHSTVHFASVSGLSDPRVVEGGVRSARLRELAMRPEFDEVSRFHNAHKIRTLRS